MAKRNLFNSIKLTRPKSNTFDLSHDVKLSLRMGKLYPTLCMEAVPGDRFKIACDSMLRFAPMLAPIMHRVDVYMHYFFVPNRLIWVGWEEFITKQLTHASIAEFNIPWIELTSTNQSKLCDYMGVPPIATGKSIKVSALAFGAYQKIFDEYYRDQNLVPAVDADLADNTPDGKISEETAEKLLTMRTRAWEHDYFTSALPFAQKGAQVSLPLAQFDDVPVRRQPYGSDTGNFEFESTGGKLAHVENLGSTNDGGWYPDEEELYAATSEINVNATNINDLRVAFRLQEWLEKAARGGSRYIESILTHFGVRSSDSRLNRPEYIVGSKSPVNISEVLSTAETEGNPQANMAGHGVSVTSGKMGSYFCEEHGFIMGIMSVMPKTAYYQGLPRQFSKFSPEEYYWPSFSNLGEQEIRNKEIYISSDDPDGTFGYIPRYSEYKYAPSRVAGDFRDTLEFWHLGRKFGNAPQLNQTFIECVPDDRIFAVMDPEFDNLYAHVFHMLKVNRPMPVFGTPMF